MEELDTKSYGVSITTLEEVFLAVNAEIRQNEDPDRPPMLIDVESSPNPNNDA